MTQIFFARVVSKKWLRFEDENPFVLVTYQGINEQGEPDNECPTLQRVDLSFDSPNVGDIVLLTIHDEPIHHENPLHPQHQIWLKHQGE